MSMIPMPVNQPVTPTITPTPPTPLEIIAKAASDSNTDPAKLSLLWELWERTKRADAEKAFNVAMSAAQEEMRPVLKDADNPDTHSRYARLETIDKTIRPIYTKHKFSLSFNSGTPRVESALRILCDVRHADGFTKAYELEGDLDTVGRKGAPNKTAIHGLGSSVSYLRRYLTCMIFNITLTNEDDDGNGASGYRPAEGYGPGWGESGSQADADEVARRRIAELEQRQADLKAGRQPSTPEPSLEEGLDASVKSKDYSTLQAFGALHKGFKTMGKEDIYYQILGEWGKKKSNEFPDTKDGRKEALACYKKMGKIYGPLVEHWNRMADIPKELHFNEWPDDFPQEQPFVVAGKIYLWDENAGNCRIVE